MTIAPALVNDAAEQAVLGAVLLEPGTLAQIRPVLTTPAPFYRERHRRLYAAMLALSDRHAPIDPVTLETALGPEHAEEFATLSADLIDATVSTANAEHHAGLVLDAWRRRLLTVQASQLTAAAADPALAVRDLVAETSKCLVRIGTEDPSTRPPALPTVFLDTLEELERQVRDRVDVRGIRSGLATFDELTDGFRPSQLAILAARPGEGKSSLATRIATRAATQAPVYLVSLEMSEAELVERMLQEAVGCDMRKLRRDHGLFDREVARLSAASGRLSQLPLTIDCQTRTPGDLRLRVLGERSQGRAPGLVIVDYLGLMDPDTKQQNRDRELGAITKALKLMAGELDTSVLALSQLSRAPAKENRPPDLTDLRDSGNIEQDANKVVMLHWPNGDQPGEVIVDCYIRKNRGGPKGKVELRFEPWTQRWREFMQPEPSYQQELDVAEEVGV